jgi:hypothetical protein
LRLRRTWQKNGCDNTYEDNDNPKDAHQLPPIERDFHEKATAYCRSLPWARVPPLPYSNTLSFSVPGAPVQSLAVKGTPLVIRDAREIGGRPPS